MNLLIMNSSVCQYFILYGVICVLCVMCYVCYVCHVWRGVCFGIGLAFPFLCAFGVISFLWAIYLHGIFCQSHSAVSESILRFH
jgi:hypothetical protein